VRGLKRLGFKRGEARWHWFGDKSPRFRPHLNFLVDAGKLTRAELAALKRMVSKVTGVPVRRLVVHYQWTEDRGKMLHWAYYVTRATFKEAALDQDMAKLVLGFKNGIPWGDWKTEDVWQAEDVTEWQGDEVQSLETVEKLERGECPKCGGEITWGGVVRVGRCRDGIVWENLGGGYYRLRERPSGSRLLTEDEEAAWAWVVENVTARRFAGTVDQN
jgi:hypothetical protein